MKKLFLGLLATVLFVCSGHAQKRMPNSGTSSGRFYIYWCSWSEWGHGGNCSGWGLCDFSDCWFCDVGDKHSGQVKFDKETKEGFLFITLNQSDPTESLAIKNRSPFMVDNDIDNKYSLLHKGTYLFDATIGNNGGYAIDITIK